MVKFLSVANATQVSPFNLASPAENGLISFVSIASFPMTASILVFSNFDLKCFMAQGRVSTNNKMDTTTKITT